MWCLESIIEMNKKAEELENNKKKAFVTSLNIKKQTEFQNFKILNKEFKNKGVINYGSFWFRGRFDWFLYY